MYLFSLALSLQSWNMSLTPLNNIEALPLKILFCLFCGQSHLDLRLLTTCLVVHLFRYDIYYEIKLVKKCYALSNMCASKNTECI